MAKWKPEDRYREFAAIADGLKPMESALFDYDPTDVAKTWSYNNRNKYNTNHLVARENKKWRFTLLQKEEIRQKENEENEVDVGGDNE